MFDLATARWIVRAFEAHLLVGFVLALLFLFVLARRIDPGLAASAFTTRLVLLPGCMLLWPLLVGRVLGGTGRLPIERNAHRNIEPSSGSPS